MPALFDSKIEAEKAARRFGCNRAHEMGEILISCHNHGVTEKEKMHNNHHQHHH